MVRGSEGWWFEAICCSLHYCVVSLDKKLNIHIAGLQIMAGQRTMSSQNWVLTGQILGLPDILSGPLPTRSEKF